MTESSLQLSTSTIFSIVFKFFLDYWWFWLLFLIIYVAIVIFKEVVKQRKYGKKFHPILEFFTNTEIEKCPECDGVLRKKRGKYGKFFGCSNYLTCRFTKPIK